MTLTLTLSLHDLIGHGPGTDLQTWREQLHPTLSTLEAPLRALLVRHAPQLTLLEVSSEGPQLSVRLEGPALGPLALCELEEALLSGEARAELLTLLKETLNRGAVALALSGPRKSASARLWVLEDTDAVHLVHDISLLDTLYHDQMRPESWDSLGAALETLGERCGFAVCTLDLSTLFDLRFSPGEREDEGHHLMTWLGIEGEALLERYAALIENPVPGPVLPPLEALLERHREGVRAHLGALLRRLYGEGVHTAIFEFDFWETGHEPMDLSARNAARTPLPLMQDAVEALLEEEGTLEDFRRNLGGASGPWNEHQQHDAVRVLCRNSRTLRALLPHARAADLLLDEARGSARFTVSP